MQVGYEPILPATVPGEPGEMERLLGLVQADIVHAGPIEPIARIAAEAGAHPLVSGSWGFDLLRDAHGADRERIAWTLSRSDALLVDCEAAAQVARDLGMPPDRIFRLPWGVDLAQFHLDPDRNASRRRLGWDGQVVVVSARAHEPVYGIDTIVDAFASAVPTVPALRLHIFGSGRLTPQLAAQARAGGAASRITFGGQVQNAQLAEYMGAADIYVAAAHVDGSSVTLLEAMAAGLPALVSDIAGNREWVEQGISGLLYPDGDASALGDSLVMLGDDASRRQAMGLRGRRIVEARADWAANRLILGDLYQTAVRVSIGRE